MHLYRSRQKQIRSMALRFPLGTNRGRLILSPVCSEFAIWLDEAQSDELGSLRRHGVRGLLVTYRHRGAASVRSIWMTGLMTPGAILRPVYALQLLRQIWCSGCAESDRADRPGSREWQCPR